VILYEHPLSPYAQKVKIALREKNVACEMRLPTGLGSGAGYAAEFTRASPRGEVPALVDGDTRLFDSTIILEYIDEKWPAPPLLPRDPAARGRARMIEDAMDTHYEAINWGLGEIEFMKRATGALAKELNAAAARQARTWWRWLERELGGAEWFGGAAFGRADLSVIPYLNGSAGFGLAPEPGSPLAAWAARANARPAVATTAAEATASRTALYALPELIAQGVFKREYRDYRLEWMIKSGGLAVVLEGLERKTIRFSPDFE
jgi:glutathione S-transferase/RNA polymerase-associated protein